MIKMYNVSYVFDKDIVAINNVTVEIKKNEFVFLTGPSGAGKTTFLKIIYGELPLTKGQLIVWGRNIIRIKPSQLPYFRRHLGIVFQDFKLLYDRTVYENVSFVLEAIGTPPSKIPSKVMKALTLVELTNKRNQTPYHLSGGEQQRVSIARAIVNEPVLLLADEPTGNLDQEVASEVINIFLKLNQIGTTIIMATHNENIPKQLNKRIIRLNKGYLVYDSGN